jgi:hypothetical protein
MAKIVTSPSFTSVSASSNPFLSADGLLNFGAVATLQKKVAEILKKDKEGDIKVTSVFVMPRKAKPEAYSESKQKSGDLKYLSRRAIKLAERKRVKPESLARVAILLQVIDGDGIPKAIKDQTKKVASAVAAHLKKAEKSKESITKAKAKIREQNNKVFAKSLEALKDMLTEGGLKEKDMLEAKGMMGSSLLIRLSAENIVSVTSATPDRWKAAQKAAKEQGDEAAPATKKKASTKKEDTKAKAKPKRKAK